MFLINKLSKIIIWGFGIHIFKPFIPFWSLVFFTNVGVIVRCCLCFFFFFFFEVGASLVSFVFPNMHSYIVGPHRSHPYQDCL